MEAPEGYQVIEESHGRAVVRADVADVPLEAWWGSGEGLPGARGRGGVCVLDCWTGARCVARSYRRGGVLRPLKERFLDAGRAERELAALVALQRAEVPTVEPLAALRRRRGLFWQLRLVTVLVEDALPLPGFVSDQPALRSAAMGEAGRVVRLAFAAGLDHPDLHPDNLLASIEGGQVCVRMIDLDRAVIRAELSASARDQMLLRMARYLERHRADLPVASRAVDVLRFLSGMGLGRAARREAIDRLRPLHDRQVEGHRLTWEKQV